MGDGKQFSDINKAFKHAIECYGPLSVSDERSVSTTQLEIFKDLVVAHFGEGKLPVYTLETGFNYENAGWISDLERVRLAIRWCYEGFQRVSDTDVLEQFMKDGVIEKLSELDMIETASVFEDSDRIEEHYQKQHLLRLSPRQALECYGHKFQNGISDRQLKIFRDIVNARSGKYEEKYQNQSWFAKEMGKTNLPRLDCLGRACYVESGVLQSMNSFKGLKGAYLDRADKLLKDNQLLKKNQ